MNTVNLILMLVFTVLSFHYFFALRKITTRRVFKYVPVIDEKESSNSAKKVHYKYIMTLIGLGMTAVVNIYLKR